MTKAGSRSWSALDDVGRPCFERMGNGEESLAYLVGQSCYTDRMRLPVPIRILTSIRLPKMPGLEMGDRLKSRSDLRRIPVSVFTGSEDPGHVAQAYHARTSSYLVKPLGHEEPRDLLQAFPAFWMGSIRV